ncbi:MULTISPECIES: RbsD/FucU family protein [unclassified Variovorax]|jgi:L-fucose mutarotase|uniref:RbsD/FucU family protein n=1 Tax=unclassified Variovorax TaxID=663243 RepID=UPI00198F77A8|nr:RbsD/FucU domain-containing protein [Variovorax sp. LG9.2]MBC7394464.1 fucose-binding protein [Variovorax sp.]MEB0060286.1 RbsD/FucU domain-containing protein [Variovorax sp. LG9.2]
MLKNIDPLLTPALLRELAAMGHGDFIAVCDANFPAYSIAAGKPLIHLPGCGTIAVLRAILSVLPLDTFDGSPVHRMEQVGRPEVLADIQREAIDTVFSRLDPVPQVAGLERFAYYAQARGACAVVLTGDTMPYGNFLLRKGVL